MTMGHLQRLLLVIIAALDFLLVDAQDAGMLICCLCTIWKSCNCCVFVTLKLILCFSFDIKFSSVWLYFKWIIQKIDSSWLTTCDSRSLWSAISQPGIRVISSQCLLNSFWSCLWFRKLHSGPQRGYASSGIDILQGLNTRTVTPHISTLVAFKAHFLYRAIMSIPIRFRCGSWFRRVFYSDSRPNIRRYGGHFSQLRSVVRMDSRKYVWFRFVVLSFCVTPCMCLSVLLSL